MLFRLALGNVRKKLRSYLSYFLSASFSVFVIYLFMSIYFSPQVRSAMINTLSESQYNVGMTLFTIAAWLVGLFSAFFIWYANSLFIKTRKKEFATYMLLGLSKGQTMVMNFIENAVLFIAAFITGLGLGVLLGKLMTMLLFNILGIKEQVYVEFSIQALKLCTIVYGSIFMLISVHGAVQLSRNTLLNLLTAGRRAERALKVHWGTWVISIIALIMFGIAYYTAVTMTTSSWMLAYLLITIVLICIATLLLFTGVLSLLIHYGRKNEKRMLQSTRLIWLNQLFFRYQGNVGTLSVIAIATSVALCAVLACTGMYVRSEYKAQLTHPFSVEFYERGGAQEIFNDVLQNHSDVFVTGKAEMNIIRADATVEGVPTYNYYIMGEGEYNHAVSLIAPNEQPVDVSEDEVVFVDSGRGGVAVDEDRSLSIDGIPNDFNLKLRQQRSMLYTAREHFNLTLVVDDDTFSTLYSKAEPEQLLKVVSMQIQDAANKGDFSDELLQKLPTQAKGTTIYSYLREDLGIIGILFFVGIFIGMVFVVATGSIIHFKMVEEAVRDADKYRMLRNIGADSKHLRNAVAKELAIVFGAPFLIAAINTLVAHMPMEEVLSVPMIQSYWWVLGIYALFYTAFYLITIRSYLRRINNV